MEKHLMDKVAIVTGASSGIGMGTSRLFASHGAKVVLAARRLSILEGLASEIKGGGGDCIAVAADVTVQADCERLLRETYAKYGRVDVLVNNAGDIDYHTPTLKCDDELWYKMIETNQSSVFRLCREALKYMEPQSSGVIVNMSAIAGVYGNAGVAYSASKAAVISITKNIAVQYAGKGIRCNAVCPGPTIVPRVVDGSKDGLFDAVFQEITERHMDMTIPFSKVEDQADVILFLASDQSRCINGQAIVTDNGMCL